MIKYNVIINILKLMKQQETPAYKIAEKSILYISAMLIIINIYFIVIN